jgi:hypothetical protein
LLMVYYQYTRISACCNPLYRKKMLESQDKKNWKVISIDTIYNNIVRFHENPNAARIELSALLGIKDLKPSRNFTKDYITGPMRKGVRAEPVKFRRRFKLMWFKDYIAEYLTTGPSGPPSRNGALICFTFRGGGAKRLNRIRPSPLIPARPFPLRAGLRERGRPDSGRSHSQI